MSPGARVRRLIASPAAFQLMRYGISGALGAATLMGSFYALTVWAHVWYLHASLASWLLSIGLGFGLQRRWTFGRREPGAGRQLALYLALLAINIGFNQLALWLLVGRGGVNPHLAQFGVLALISLWNFVIMRRVIFRAPAP